MNVFTILKYLFRNLNKNICAPSFQINLTKLSFHLHPKRERHRDQQVLLRKKGSFLSSCQLRARVENIAKDLFTVSEVLESRENFRLMSWNETHSVIIGKLQTFIRVSKQSVSAHTTKLRERQQFDDVIHADRPVCRTVFLVYHGESIDRLNRHQKYFTERGTRPPSHGNTGRTPQHACTPHDTKHVKTFIKHVVAVHGLPDPGRDVRAEKGRLKVY